MIADKNLAQVTGHIDGDVAKLGIDQENMAHIMGILTNMYPDPERAIVREYATNAYDAHIEAGQTRPIEVETPTSLSPYLKITDFGTGLSVEDVHTMYSRYGASSKRGTNAQTGMLGIGSKSGLTYADQFTIVSVKDGVKLTCVVSRDEDGGGSMTIPDTRSTTEGNGTEVTIPVQRQHQFVQKATDIFQYWPKGTVLVNGTEPTRWNDHDYIEAIEVAPGIHYVKGREAQSVVVMGNVAYPTSYFKDRIDDLDRRGRLVVFVPIGSVMFVPSREGLHYTKRTKDYLDTVVSQYKDGVKQAIQKRADSADSALDALRLVIDWADLPGAPFTTAITYRGERLPDNYDGDVMIHNPNERVPYWSRQSKCYVKAQKGVPATMFHKALWVWGWKPAKFTTQHKEKMLQWCRDNGLGGNPAADQPSPISMFVMLDQAPVSKFIDPKQVVGWDEVRKVKIGTVVTNGNGRPRRLTGSYDLVTQDDRHRETPANDPILQPKPGKTCIYVNANMWAVWNGHTNGRAKNVWKDYVIACLPANRITKFCRDFPHFQSFNDALVAEGNKFAARITDAQKLALAIYNTQNPGAYGAGRVYEALRVLDPSRIDDPDLTAAVKASTVEVEGMLKKQSLLSVRIKTPPFTNPLAKYPLFDSMHAKHDHTYLYLNAAYAAAKESV